MRLSVGGVVVELWDGSVQNELYEEYGKALKIGSPEERCVLLLDTKALIWADM